MALAKVEFDVEMTCDACVDAVRKSLDSMPGIQNVDINLDKNQVVVETTLPSSEILEKIEATGRRAVLKGYGSDDCQHMGAAVAAVTGDLQHSVVGVVRFLQLNKDTCLIDGTIDGLTPGKHGLHVHEYGDISSGCSCIGDHYNPFHKQHGSPTAEDKHAGDLGNILADNNGRAIFRLENNALKVWDIIGRSIAITENEDDYGMGETRQSLIDGNSGEGLACGIIARSAGLFENPKRLCVCSGKTIWEERQAAVNFQHQHSKI